jgi:hypothetical protein
MNISEDGTLEIKPKTILVTEQYQIPAYSFTYSSVISCSINESILTYPNFSKILENIYTFINDGVKIIQTPSTFHLKTGEHHTEGFQYLPVLGISYQRKDANGCIKEIFHQAKNHNIKINIMIKLVDNRIVIVKC